MMVPMQYGDASLDNHFFEKNLQSGKKQLSVKSTQENPLLTDQVMYSYLRTLEYIIQANSATRVFNFYSHGAEIKQASVSGSANKLKCRAFSPVT